MALHFETQELLQGMSHYIVDFSLPHVNIFFDVSIFGAISIHNTAMQQQSCHILQVIEFPTLVLLRCFEGGTVKKPS